VKQNQLDEFHFLLLRNYSTALLHKSTVLTLSCQLPRARFKLSPLTTFFFFIEETIYICFRLCNLQPTVRK